MKQKSIDHLQVFEQCLHGTATPKIKHQQNAGACNNDILILQTNKTLNPLWQCEHLKRPKTIDIGWNRLKYDMINCVVALW